MRQHHQSRLITALKYKDEKRVRSLLEIYVKYTNANVNTRDIHGVTPLHYAVKSGSKGIVRILLNKEAEVDARDCNNQTPLHLAAELGDIRITEILLDRNADVDAESSHDGTPFHTALRQGYEDVTRLLVKYGANVNFVDRHGETPLFYNSKLTKILLAEGADINFEFEFNVFEHSRLKETPLKHHYSLYHGLGSSNMVLKEMFLHVIKLIEAGLFVSDENCHIFWSSGNLLTVEWRDELRSHLLECRQELKRIEGRLTKNNLFTKSPRYVLNKTLARQLELLNCNDFPIYGPMMKSKFARDKRRVTLPEKSKEFFRKLVEGDRRVKGLFLPDELLGKILCHLSDRDLQNLIKAELNQIGVGESCTCISQRVSKVVKNCGTFRTGFIEPYVDPWSKD